MELKKRHLQMYMRIAEAVAETSSAQRLRVGAVAIKNNQVIATAYNGLASGVDGSCEEKDYMHFDTPSWIDWQDVEVRWPYEDEDGERRYALVTREEVNHAEFNLIVQLAKSTESSKGCTVVLTHSCCAACSRLLHDAGVEKVYFKHMYRDDSGIEYLKANGVEVVQLI